MNCTTKNNRYTIVEIRDIDDAFIRSWQTLWGVAVNANAFNSYDWFATCTKGSKNNVFIVYAAYDGDDLAAVLPLTLIRCYGIRTACTLAREFSIDTPFLVRAYDKQLFAEFFGKILAAQNVHFVKMDIRSTTILHHLFPRTLFPLMSMNPYLDLGSNPLRFVSHSDQREIGRVLRKSKGQYRIVLHGPNDGLEWVLEMMFEIDQKSGKAVHARDIFSKERFRSFYRFMVQHCRRFVRVAVLYYGETPVAYMFGFLQGKTFFAYQMSYLAEYKQLYPGKIMTVKLLEQFQKDALADRIDFGGGITAYKREFTPVFYRQYDAYHSWNPLVMAWWTGVNMARRAKQVVFPGKYTRDGEFLFRTFSSEVEAEQRLVDVAHDDSFVHYSYRIVRQLDDSLTNDWQALWERSPNRHLFNSPGFFAACREAFGIHAYAAIFVFRNEALCGVLPLAEGRIFGIKGFKTPGSTGNFVDRSPLLVDEYSSDFIRILCAAMDELGNVMLAEIAEDAVALLPPRGSFRLDRWASESFWAEVSEDAEYMSGESRRTLQSRLRKVDGHVTFDTHGIEALPTAIAVEEQSHRPARRMALFARPHAAKLIRAIARHIPGSVRVSVLSVNGKPVATELGFANDGIFYGYHTAFVEKCRKIGAGRLCVYFLFERVKKEGFRIFDLLRGDDGVKRQFTCKSRTQFDVYLSNHRIVIVWWRFSLALWRTLKRAAPHVRAVYRSSRSWIFSWRTNYRHSTLQHAAPLAGHHQHTNKS